MNRLVLFNARYWNQDHFAQGWVAIQDNRFTQLGIGNVPSSLLLDHQCIDAQGQFILPGLHDAHIHVYALGRALSSLDLHGCTSIQQLQSRVKTFISLNPHTKVIWGVGWDQTLLGRMPTSKDLDELCVEVPVLLSRRCLHAGVVNGVVLGMVGGVGKVDVMFEDEWNEVWERFDECVCDEVKLGYLRAGMSECIKRGLGAVQTNDRGCWRLYKELEQRGELNMRVFLTIGYDEIAPGYSQAVDTPVSGETVGMLLSCDRVKIFQDGSLGAETAALSEDYDSCVHGHGNKGMLFHNAQELADMLSHASQLGFRVEIHVIGDRALSTALDAVQLSGKCTVRPVLTHCQITSQALLGRMRELEVIANVQPQFYVTDYESAMVSLGENRMRWSYCWKSMIDAGIVVSGGSDAPVESPSPFEGMHAAVFRRAESIAEREQDSECLSFQQALDLYTTKAAYAANQEQRLGKLQSGFLADFVICELEFDSNGIPQSSLKNVRPNQVWVDGVRRL